MKKNKHIGIIIVSYKNFQMTTRFVKEEIPKIDVDYTLIIVNVASNQLDSQELAQKAGVFFAGEELSSINEDQQKLLIWSSNNLGYAKGNNMGVEYLKKAHRNCHYYLFTNDDIEIHSDRLLQSLTSKAETSNHIAGIGPRVVCRDGAEGSPQRDYFSPWHIIGEYFFKSLRGTRQKNCNGEPNKIAPSEGSAYWISGAFMLVKADWFEKVKGFDPATFLYYEEAILAEKFKIYGGHFYYYPQVEILHYEGGSTHKNVKNKQKNRIVENSRLYYYKKYRNESKISLLIYQVFCLLKRLI